MHSAEDDEQYETSVTLGIEKLGREDENLKENEMDDAEKKLGFVEPEELVSWPKLLFADNISIFQC